MTAAAIERREVVGPDTVAFPLIVSRNAIEQGLGAITFGWPAAHAPTDDEIAFLRAIADLVAVAVDRFRLTSTIAERSEWFERLAHTDPLTGLANMRTFSRVLELELARAGRQRSEVSVAVFDVDDFAATNDAAGREGGDDVLRSVAAVIAGAVRLRREPPRRARRQNAEAQPHGGAGYLRRHPSATRDIEALRVAAVPPRSCQAARPSPRRGDPYWPLLFAVFLPTLLLEPGAWL